MASLFDYLRAGANIGKAAGSALANPSIMALVRRRDFNGLFDYFVDLTRFQNVPDDQRTGYALQSANPCCVSPWLRGPYFAILRDDRLPQSVFELEQFARRLVTYDPECSAASRIEKEVARFLRSAADDPIHALALDAYSFSADHPEVYRAIVQGRSAIVARLSHDFDDMKARLAQITAARMRILWGASSMKEAAVMPPALRAIMKHFSGGLLTKSKRGNGRQILQQFGQAYLTIRSAQHKEALRNPTSTRIPISGPSSAARNALSIGAEALQPALDPTVAVHGHSLLSKIDHVLVAFLKRFDHERDRARNQGYQDEDFENHFVLPERQALLLSCLYWVSDAAKMKKVIAYGDSSALQDVALPSPIFSETEWSRAGRLAALYRVFPKEINLSWDRRHRKKSGEKEHRDQLEAFLNQHLNSPTSRSTWAIERFALGHNFRHDPASANAAQARAACRPPD